VPESVAALPVEGSSDVVAGGEVGRAAEPRGAVEVGSGSVRVFTVRLGSEGRLPDGAATVTETPGAAVVTTGTGNGAVAETVATGVVTVTAGVVTAGVVTVVGAIGPVVGTGGTVTVTAGTVTAGTVTVGSVTVTPPGRAVASPFATKKPATAKQTSMTVVLHFTKFHLPVSKPAAPTGNWFHLYLLR
jgi:hypothetical protein